MFWNYFNIQDFEDIYHTIIQYSESSSNRNKLHKGYVWPKRSVLQPLDSLPFLAIPWFYVCCLCFLIQTCHMTFVLCWDDVRCHVEIAKLDLQLHCWQHVCMLFLFRLDQEYIFWEVIKSYLLWLFFFTYTSTDTQYLSSKFLRSLGLLDSRFYGMWDVASLGAGVSAGKERVRCTIDSSCDLSDFDFQERVILILYVSVYVDSILSAYFHEID